MSGVGPTAMQARRGSTAALDPDIALMDRKADDQRTSDRGHGPRAGYQAEQPGGSDSA